MAFCVGVVHKPCTLHHSTQLQQYNFLAGDLFNVACKWAWHAEWVTLGVVHF